jgi:uncharacterized protein
MELPKFQDYVNDYSQVLDKSSRSELNQLASEFEKYTWNTQIVTVLFPHRQWNELLEIWLKAFRENWIWQKDKNNGLLLLISTDEKKIRILVWYWLEWAIPDAKATEIINEKIRPRVNSGDYVQAIRNFYTESTEIIKNESFSWNGFINKNNDTIYGILSWVLVGLFLYFLLKTLKSTFIFKFIFYILIFSYIFLDNLSIKFFREGFLIGLILVAALLDRIWFFWWWRSSLFWGSGGGFSWWWGSSWWGGGWD